MVYVIDRISPLLLSGDWGCTSSIPCLHCLYICYYFPCIVLWMSGTAQMVCWGEIPRSGTTSPTIRSHLYSGNPSVACIAC